MTAAATGYAVHRLATLARGQNPDDETVASWAIQGVEVVPPPDVEQGPRVWRITLNGEALELRERARPGRARAHRRWSKRRAAIAENSGREVVMGSWMTQPSRSSTTLIGARRGKNFKVSPEQRAAWFAMFDEGRMPIEAHREQPRQDRRVSELG